MDHSTKEKARGKVRKLGRRLNGHFTENLYSVEYYCRGYDIFFGLISDHGRKVGVRELGVKRGEHILEIGIGTALSVKYYPKGCRVTGIDLSQRMLMRARHRIRRLNLKNVHISRMDALQLAFRDNQFDKIIAPFFLTVVRDPMAAIMEMKRVCRPGGCILFLNHFMSTNVAFGSFEKLIEPISKLIGFHTDLPVKKILSESDLHVERIIPVPPGGLWKIVRCINP